MDIVKIDVVDHHLVKYITFFHDFFSLFVSRLMLNKEVLIFHIQFSSW